MMKRIGVIGAVTLAVASLCFMFMSSRVHRGMTDTAMGKVYYEYQGRSKGNATLVFVHGLGCDLNTWKYQRKAFKDNRIICIDLPGFGKSDKPEADYTLHQYADAIHEVLSGMSEDFGRVVLVGHSLGSAVCRQYVFDYPDEVKALVDIDGVYCLYPQDTTSQEYAEYKAAVDAFAGSFDSEDVGAVFEGFVASLAGPDTPKEVTDYAMSVMPRTPRHVAANTMRNLVKKQNWTGAVIEVPTLVICTQNSGLMPDNKQQMEALYSNLQYEELTTCGHFIHMEQADRFNGKLKTFIGE